MTAVPGAEEECCDCVSDADADFCACPCHAFQNEEDEQ